MAEREHFSDIVIVKPEQAPRYSIFLKHLKKTAVCRNFALAWWPENRINIGFIRADRVTETDSGVPMSTNTEMAAAFGEKKSRDGIDYTSTNYVPDDVDYITHLIRRDDPSSFETGLRAAWTAMCNVDFTIKHLVHLDSMNDFQRRVTVVAVEAAVVRGFERRFDWLVQDVSTLITDGLIRSNQQIEQLKRSYELFLELKANPSLAIEKDLLTYDLNRPLFTYFRNHRVDHPRVQCGMLSVLVCDKFRLEKKNLKVMQGDRSAVGLESFFKGGGDLIKYLYSTYNEIFQYSENKKQLAKAQGKTVMKRSDKLYKIWSKDPNLKNKVYVDDQPAFYPLEKDDLDKDVAETCHQRCVAYAAMAEKIKLSAQVMFVTDTLWREKLRLDRQEDV